MPMKIRLALVVILLFETNVIEAKVNIYTDDSPENGSKNFLGYKVPSADEIAESWVQSQIYQNKEEKSDEINHDEDQPQVSRESFTVGKNWMIKKYCVKSKDDKECMEIGMKEGISDFPVRIRIRSHPSIKKKTLVSQEMENKDEILQKKMAFPYKEDPNRLSRKKRSLDAENDNDGEYEDYENYQNLEENQDDNGKMDDNLEEEPKRVNVETNKNSDEASSGGTKILTKRKSAKGENNQGSDEANSDEASSDGTKTLTKRKLAKDEKNKDNDEANSDEASSDGTKTLTKRKLAKDINNKDSDEATSDEARSDGTKTLTKRKLTLIEYKDRDEASSDDTYLQTKKKSAGLQDPYLDSNPSKSASHVISAGAYQMHNCRLPRLGSNAEILCKKWNTAMSCNLYCAHGYTFKEGIKRKTHCKFNEGKWTKKMEECKPFMDCSLHLKGAGSIACVNNRLEKGNECEISCAQQGRHGSVGKQTYTCNVGKRWDPELPPCAEPEGIDLVQGPSQRLMHERIGYPNKHPFPDSD